MVHKLLSYGVGLTDDDDDDDNVSIIDVSRIWNHEPWVSRQAIYPENTEADSLCTRPTIYL